MTNFARPGPSHFIILASLAILIGIPVLWLLAPKFERYYDSAKLAALPQSKPIEVNGVRFAIAGPTEWILEAAGKPHRVLLRITNTTDGDLVFPTFDTFALRLYRSDGSEIPSHCARDWTGETEPVIVRSGREDFISINPAIRKSAHRVGHEMHFVDKSGTYWRWDLDGPGEYEMAFAYSLDSVSGTRLHRKIWNAGAEQTPRWNGDVVTHRLRVSIRATED